MLPRDRVKLALSRQVPDRMPIYADYVPEVCEQMLRHFGTEDYYEMCVKAGNDMLMISGGGMGDSYYHEQETYQCSWGCTWKHFRNEQGSYTEIIDAPLWDDPDGKKLDAYCIPTPDCVGAKAAATDLIERYGKTHWICGAITCSIFEAAWYLHGLEDTVMDMVSQPEYMEALFDKVMEHPLQIGLSFAEAGVDMLWLGDDVGMQERMLLSPDMWRTYLKPRMGRLIAAFKAKNPDVLVAYHSCGYIEPILEELIEIGVDVLNPVQPLAMDPTNLKREYGDRLSFWGGIDIQKTLPKGTVQEIREEVRLRKNTIGAGGGYLCGPAHTVQADTSLQNLLALYDAVREDGVYG